MPLSHHRVLEIGDIPAASYASRLFADFDADVIKIEPPNGQADRQDRPAADGECDGLWFAYLNFNKRRFALNAGNVEDRATLRSLVYQADIVIDSLSPADREKYGLDYNDIRERRPDLIVTRVSWFGIDGPYADFQGTDMVCRALAGASKLVGPKEGPPVTLSDYQSAYFGGLYAYIATVASLRARLETGQGQSHDVSVHDATIALSEYQVADAWELNKSQVRDGVSRFAPTYPAGVYECRSGLLGVTLITPAQWASFCAMIGAPELAQHPVYSTRLGRYASADELEPLLVSRLRERSAQEWFEDAINRRLPVVVVPSMDDVLSTKVFRERGRIVPVETASNAFEAPGSPLNLTLTPPRAGGVVAKLQGGATAWQTERASVPHATAADATGLPLTGIRIVDLTMGWAGPLCTRIMADLGAEVIKVEACRYPDWWRGTEITRQAVDNKDYEKIARFNFMNRNKKAVTFDLTQVEGIKLLKDLVRTSDAVVENYSASVLRKLGLPYEVLREVNPSLVMVSMSAFGSSGIWSEVRAYGTTLEHGSGLPGLSGYEGGPYVMHHVGYGDPIGGLNAAAALLTALIHKKRTGLGQYVDLSLVECMLPLVAPWAMLQSVGAEIRRHGSRHPQHVPNGYFRCAGEDEWVAISVVDDAAWKALCRVIGRDELADLDHAARREREDALEACINEWTLERAPDEVMRVLQKRGVAAGAVRSPFDLLTDPHLTKRAFWQRIDRLHLGPHPQASAAFRIGAKAYQVHAPAPTLGQDNEEVIVGMLGRDNAEFESLKRDGVIGTEAHVLVH